MLLCYLFSAVENIWYCDLSYTIPNSARVIKNVHFKLSSIKITVVWRNTFVTTLQANYKGFYVFRKYTTLKDVSCKQLSDAYMHQQTMLVQIMACHLLSDNQWSKPMMVYCQWDLRNILQWNFIYNSKVFNQENAYKMSYVKIASIFSRRSPKISYCN